MAGWKFAVLVANKGCFLRQSGRACANRKLFVCTGWHFRTASKGLCKEKAFCLKKEGLSSAVRKNFLQIETFLKIETFLIDGKGCSFQPYAKPTDKKSSSSAQQNFNFAPHPN